MLSEETKNKKQKFHSAFIHLSSFIHPCKIFTPPWGETFTRLRSTGLDFKKLESFRLGFLWMAL